MYKTTSFKLALLSPTFLGDANQSAAWRSPPFKALLREWWRVAAASAHRHSHEALRYTEGVLLGNAWLDSGATQSKVRISLEHWKTGTATTLGEDVAVRHPEIGETGRLVGSQLYLGYGPITYDKASKKSKLKANAALQANETNTLDLAWPSEHDPILSQTVQLIDWFGTMGGRSRNGWGSVSRVGLKLKPLTATASELTAVLRDLKDCLQLDWPHALGKDQSGALIWESKDTFADWKAAMTFLAKLKIGFRTALKFTTGNYSRIVEGRHTLAYPVTHHSVSAWGGQARLANQLRFKLFLDPSGKLKARIFHTPHKCPLPITNSLNQLTVWQSIHQWMDQQPTLQRLKVSS